MPLLKINALPASTALKCESRVSVFGSFARGEERPDSDLDLLIEAGPARTPFFPAA